MLPTYNREESVEAIKKQIINDYPSIWRDMISKWEADSPEDVVWLMYSSNYVFRTQNVRWAIDPLTIYSRLNLTPPFDLAADLQQLDFILLTHNHADHLDLPLIRALSRFPIRWVIPQFLLPLLEDCHLDPKNVILPEAMETIHLCGIDITPFDGLHHHITTDGEAHGVPAMGYHIRCGSQTWLFPGDTRSHQPDKIPIFPPVDAVFAHLWLGKACADMPIPPKVEDFCRFFLALDPKRIIITHLHEIGRDYDEFWDERHYELVWTRFAQLAPDLPVVSAVIGQSIRL